MRQVGRLLLRYRDNGGGGLVHKVQGKPSNRRATKGVREYALELVRTQYRDFVQRLPSKLSTKCGIRLGGRPFKHGCLEPVSGLRANSVALYN